jgi:hypothetical protein
LRVLVYALVLPLASAGALPSWALLFGVEGPHVCHCSVEQHECFCPKCNPDQADQLALSSESIQGRCGDDDIAFGGKAFCAVVPATGVLVASVTRAEMAPAAASRVPDLNRAPPTPPPRSSSFSV